MKKFKSYIEFVTFYFVYKMRWIIRDEYVKMGQIKKGRSFLGRVL